MTGAFTQSLANLTSEEAHIKALTGLPGEAQKVQAASAALVITTVASLKTAQSTALAFAPKATEQLEAVEKQLEAKAPADQVLAALNEISSAAKKVLATMANADAITRAATNEVAGYSNQLAQIETQLNEKKTALVGAMNTAKDDAAAAKSKRWYWLLLGPFGIAGAAAALALFITETNKANDLESQANALQAQISRQNALVAATKQMGNDFVALLSRIQNLQNASNIVGSDIDELLQDAKGGDTSLVIQLHVKAAISEVATLAADAA